MVAAVENKLYDMVVLVKVEVKWGSVVRLRQ